MIHQLKQYQQRVLMDRIVREELSRGVPIETVLKSLRVSELRKLCTLHNVLCGRGTKLNRVTALVEVYKGN